MAFKDKDTKHVIILDEGKKEDNADTDEALLLLSEIDEYIGEEAGEPDMGEAEKPGEKQVKVRPKRTVSSGFKKLTGFLAVSLLVLAVVLMIAFGELSTGYREPVRIYEKYLNTRDFDGEELSYSYANGLARHQFKALREAQRKMPGYEDMLMASRQANIAAYDETCTLYGEGRKYSLTIDEAVPLNDGELLALTGDFQGIIRDLAGSSYARSSEQALTEALKELTDKVGHAHITKGYRLHCTQNIRGSGEDGPVSPADKCEFTVVKLNGHWIMWDKIYDIFRMTY